MKKRLITSILSLMIALTLISFKTYATQDTNPSETQAAQETETQEATETQQATETETETSEVLNGIVKKDGKIYYYKDNVLVKGQLVKVNGKRYYFTKKGAALTNSWKTIDGDKYYFGKNGAAYQRSHKIGKHYYVFRMSGKLCKGKGKRIVKVDGKRYYVNKKGRALSGWRIRNGNMLYAYKSGKLATNKKIGYIKLNSKGYAKNKWQAFARYYARKFINKHTKSSWSKKRKLRACFNYLCSHRHYVAHVVTDTRASTTNGWQYWAAVHMLSSSWLGGNCRCFASAFAAIAKELGYKPVVCSMSTHSMVRINGKYYDYMYGGQYGTSYRWYFTPIKKTFRF